MFRVFNSQSVLDLLPCQFIDPLSISRMQGQNFQDSSLYRGVRISQVHTKQLSGPAHYRPRYQLRPTTSVQPVIRVRHSECLVIRRMLMTYGYHANTTLYDQSRTLTDGSVCFIISLHTGVQVVVRGIILITVNKRTLFLPPPWIKEDFHMTQQRSE